MAVPGGIRMAKNGKAAAPAPNPEESANVQVTVTMSRIVWAAINKVAAQRRMTAWQYLQEFFDEYGHDEWIPDAEEIRKGQEA